MAAPIAELFATVKSSGSQRCAGTIFDSWMQGRTTFGGLSAALCRLLARRALWRGRTRSIASTRPAPPRVAPPARTNANDAPRTGSARGDFAEQVVL